MITLRPYQLELARSALRIAEDGAGGTIAAMFARQSGKNETSAYIERALLLLTNGRRHAGTGIKAAPTLKPQAEVSRRRLISSLRSSGLSRLVRAVDQFVELGPSRWGFFSAGKDSNVVGQTADIALECDEAQDVDPDKWNKDFMPMAATTNAPAIYYGTPWTDDDLLAQMIARAREEQECGGPPRAFVVKWDRVAEIVPAYGRYVDRERLRLGANHPLFLTQYEMQTIPGAGRLLSPAQLAAMRGQHPRELAPAGRATYVAGVDVAGEDSLTPLRGRDATVLTIGRVIWPITKEPPDLEIVNTYAWTGTPHDQLYANIVAILRAWAVRRAAIDTTAAGEALGLYASRALGDDKVIRYRFTQLSKSNLGFGLQAAATTGRITVYADDGSREYAELFRQLTACRAEYKPNRTVAWSVPEADGHDDYVASLALCNHAAEQSDPPRIARGRVPRKG